MEQHFVGKIGIKLILARGNKILLTKDHYDPIWDLPGGRLDVGESIEEAINREISEELGAAVALKNLFWSAQLKHTKDPSSNIFLFFEANFVDPNVELKVPSQELSATMWAGKEDLKNIEMYPHIAAAVKKYFKE